MPQSSGKLKLNRYGKGNISVSLKTIASFLITCSNCNSPINGKHVVLCITDDGPGICSESITHSLQSIQGKSKLSGLAIISKLVHDANGHMVIESSSIDKNILEQGTSIKLFLKIADTGSEKTFTDKKTLELSSIADKRVMIVDDENSVATFLGELLKVTGFRVSVFVDSTEALSTFQSSPDEFDLVVTDQTMPILTGDLLASKMLEIRPTLPVILCTGHSDIMNLEKALALNIQGFLKKLIDTTELLGLIIKLLSKKSARS